MWCGFQGFVLKVLKVNVNLLYKLKIKKIYVNIIYKIINI